jgi:hypothetical protein
MIGRTTALGMLLALLAGCGQHFWQRSGGTVQDFDRDSLACVDEARTGRHGVGAEDRYRGCLKQRGWLRVQAPVGDAHQFRGPEDAEDLAVPPPSPYSGTRYNASQAELRAAGVAVVCRRPPAMRPGRVVCPAGN